MNMPELPQLSLPDPAALLEAARSGWTGLAWPATGEAATGLTLGLALGLALAAALLITVAMVLVARRRSRIRALEARSEEATARVQTLETLLADVVAEAAVLRQRVGELAARQDSLVTGQTRTGLRQAIALSRHGATTRQLIETCSLSQGEAHLIQTLYGRPAGEPAADGLH